VQSPRSTSKKSMVLRPLAQRLAPQAIPAMVLHRLPRVAMRLPRKSNASRRNAIEPRLTPAACAIHIGKPLFVCVVWRPQCEIAPVLSHKRVKRPGKRKKARAAFVRHFSLSRMTDAKLLLQKRLAIAKQLTPEPAVAPNGAPSGAQDTNEPSLLVIGERD